jgi:co-chaperonin GroES (HSP10)
MFDRVLIEKAEVMTRTRGGIVIPEKAQQKVLQGTVVAVGPGARTEVNNNKSDHKGIVINFLIFAERRNCAGCCEGR